MTPTQLINAIRQRHNAVGDNFYSDEEILSYVYEACCILAREARVIEAVYTTTTTSGTREYSYPTNTIAIKRVEYNGAKLQPISFREDDQITGLNASTTSTGTPQYYSIWNETLYLRPIPNSSSATLKIFSFNEPQSLTTLSTLEIPTQFQPDTILFALSWMAGKERNFESATYFMNEWEKRVEKAKAWSKKRLRGDSLTNVVDLESMSESFLGTI
jgi:hypothetical protein